MFKNIIYFNSQKVAEYSAILKNERQIDIQKIRKSNSKSVGGSISLASGKYDSVDEVEGKIIDNPIFDSNEFEQLLEKKNNDSFFDMTKNNDITIDSIPKGTIMRFEGFFKIPEEFDMMDLINSFKPMLTTQMDLKNEGEEEIFKQIFGKESTKIPAFFDCDSFDNRVGFAKIDSNNIKYQLSELEDFEDEEVTVIAKVLSRKTVNSSPIIVFDIMKDLFSLNRAMRRQLDERKDGVIENIKSEKDIITLEVLSIYQ